MGGATGPFGAGGAAEFGAVGDAGDGGEEEGEPKRWHETTYFPPLFIWVGGLRCSGRSNHGVAFAGVAHCPCIALSRISSRNLPGSSNGFSGSEMSE